MQPDGSDHTTSHAVNGSAKSHQVVSVDILANMPENDMRYSIKKAVIKEVLDNPLRCFLASCQTISIIVGFFGLIYTNLERLAPKPPFVRLQSGLFVQANGNNYASALKFISATPSIIDHMLGEWRIVLSDGTVESGKFDSYNRDSFRVLVSKMPKSGSVCVSITYNGRDHINQYFELLQDLDYYAGPYVYEGADMSREYERKCVP